MINASYRVYFSLWADSDRTAARMLLVFGLETIVHGVRLCLGFLEEFRTISVNFGKFGILGVWDNLNLEKLLSQ